MKTIAVSTNQIHFEDFEAPAGLEDRKEIQRMWEKKLTEIIEAAGYECEIDIGYGKDPAISASLNIEGTWCWWSNLNFNPKTSKEVADIAETITTHCHDGDNCDCRGPLIDLLGDLLPSVQRDADLVAQKALDAAKRAAEEYSQELVRLSESNQ